MSGATVAYNLRQNKHVERQLFSDLLNVYERWQSLQNYLYVGFGGVYFEDYKLLHTAFGIDKMVSLEQEEWMLARQNHNLPFGCIEPRHQRSLDFILEVDEQRTKYSVDNLLVWLDYASPRELPDQLMEVRALTSKLIPGDILKVTLSLHTGWLERGAGFNLDARERRRFQNLSEKFGATYLPEGITLASVRESNLPELYAGILRRAIITGMEEIPGSDFIPLGCYSYSDGTQMLTVTGAVVRRENLQEFHDVTRIADFPLASSEWSVHRIKVPDLSLKERIALDASIYTPQMGIPAATCETGEIADKLGFQLAADRNESLELIANYVKLYKYYPNYHRVQL